MRRHRLNLSLTLFCAMVVGLNDEPLRADETAERPSPSRYTTADDWVLYLLAARDTK